MKQFQPYLCKPPIARHRISAKAQVIPEDIQTGTVILKASVQPRDESRVTTVVGITENGAVPSTAKVIISREAFSGVGFCLSSISMERSARGVEAFPMPRMFAQIAAVMTSQAGVDAESGKMNLRSGAMTEDSLPMAPAFFNTSRMPHQRHIIPHMENIRFTAEEQPSITAPDKTEMSPAAAE